MFYHFLYPLRDIFFGFNVLHYITFRAAMAAVTAFVLCLILGQIFIPKFASHKIREKVKKEDSDKLDILHGHKAGTPTMGGVFILLSLFITVLLWADLTNKFILLSLFVSLYLGLLGAKDDLLKQKGKVSKGLSAKAKLFWQVLLGLIVGAVLYLDPNFSLNLSLPFLKNVVIDAGLFYILFAALVIVATSNAVNITDGLDGLAIGCISISALTIAILSYISGNLKFSEYLFLPYIQDAGELTVYCSAIFGASLGFLWYNCHPAEIFMGDVGSLALGGTLGAIAIFIKKEFLLVLLGGIFVIEAASVILQVGSFKLRKKRIFKIAPLHHHFQFLGWDESKVIIRFWIIAIILALITLATLKLR
ncbi:MAG: phospho-N-acetylmuramoyl-pentapeptide-transferase [Candidatus Omnitrophica bacterium]|nr:phospho-N-acetylmuramoyl-pentapeptide-transferase [Candidatus Omnitrophota bacterium]HOX55173.1 phospho-N-acetylmuramoyl-pentapeptide-transferase [Candidatus Omnitrophota bacterium]